MDFDTMKENAKLRAHTINFKMGIKSFVDNLDDPECLVILIQKNTANHFKRGIRTEQFQVSHIYRERLLLMSHAMRKYVFGSLRHKLTCSATETS